MLILVISHNFSAATFLRKLKAEKLTTNDYRFLMFLKTS